MNSSNVLSLNETWLTSSHCTDEFDISGYDFYHLDRPLPKTGGGVGIYINKRLTWTKVISFTSPLEYIGIQISPHNAYSYLVFSIYLPPNQPLTYSISHLDNLLAHFSRHSYCYILGDFNFDLLRQVNGGNFDILSLMRSYQYIQLIQDPTRLELLLLPKLLLNISTPHVLNTIVNMVSSHALVITILSKLFIKMARGFLNLTPLINFFVSDPIKLLMLISFKSIWQLFLFMYWILLKIQIIFGMA